jgi:hypothetical protein
MFVWGKKMISNTGAQIGFAVGQEIVRAFFYKRSILFTDTFDKVDWPSIHHTFHDEVPRLFQVWACKQVIVIAVNNRICDDSSAMAEVRNVHAAPSQGGRRII